QHGIAVEYHEFPMGNSVRPESMAVVGDFIRRCLNIVECRGVSLASDSPTMTPNNRLLALATTAWLVTAVPAARAAIAIAASLDQKVENAASIVVGKCIKTESRMDPTGRWILTYSTFEVQKSLKGVAGPQITIVTPGGTVGSTHQDTIGVPEFHEGAEHVIFVKNSRVGPTVLYFDQGAYDVTTDGHCDKI